jgi:hypothetical protein
MTTPAQECSSVLDLPDQSLAEALAGYEDALGAVPWLSVWPMMLRGVRVRRNGERLFLCSDDGEGIALPMPASQTNIASPLLAMEMVDGFGLWDGYFFRLCLAQTALGRWVSE